MGLRDVLRKKDKVEPNQEDQHVGNSANLDLSPQRPQPRPRTPDIILLRSDTDTQEVLQPPSGPSSRNNSRADQTNLLSPPNSPSANDSTSPPTTPGSITSPTRSRRISDVFRPKSRASSFTGLQQSPSATTTTTTTTTTTSATGPSEKPALTRRPTRGLSQRLHLHRAPPSSDNVPEYLPEIVPQSRATTGAATAAAVAATATEKGLKKQHEEEGGEQEDKYHTESQWEQRATLLARTVGENEGVFIRSARSRTPSPEREAAQQRPQINLGGDFGKSFINKRGSVVVNRMQEDSAAAAAAAAQGTRAISPAVVDADIQEAIRLHEEGDLRGSTRIFAMLADRNGPNDALSQVLYGLALRHGWGCDPDPERAVFYLTSAASNAASVETLALEAGMKKGGAAKGELVLAIFELANCFRHGWGIERDPIAAKQYYETAANLGDTDAMNEAGWCYLEGFGCKKDKVASAKYYRLAETNGNKTLGNTWIWKPKYDPDYKKK